MIRYAVFLRGRHLFSFWSRGRMPGWERHRIRMEWV